MKTPFYPDGRVPIRTMMDLLTPIAEHVGESLATAYAHADEAVVECLLGAHLAIWKLRWELGQNAPIDEERQENRGQPAESEVRQ